jgi:hypothetical protein
MNMKNNMQEKHETEIAAGETLSIYGLVECDHGFHDAEVGRAWRGKEGKVEHYEWSKDAGHFVKVGGDAGDAALRDDSPNLCLL